MNIIEKGTKFIVGDEDCGYGIYIAIKDIDLENAIYDIDAEDLLNITELLEVDNAPHLIDVLQREGFIRSEEQFPYLNLCNNSVSLENYPNY